VVHTDPFLWSDAARILPLGGPQDTILNRMLRQPRLAQGRSVFEPFAGAGAFGLMALKLGARHAKRPGPSRWVVALDLLETYGVEPYPAATNGELVLGRVMENVIPAES
jgi:hypothetical protein